MPLRTPCWPLCIFLKFLRGSRVLQRFLPTGRDSLSPCAVAAFLHPLGSPCPMTPSTDKAFSPVLDSVGISGLVLPANLRVSVLDQRYHNRPETAASGSPTHRLGFVPVPRLWAGVRVDSLLPPREQVCPALEGFGRSSLSVYVIPFSPYFSLPLLVPASS